MYSKPKSRCTLALRFNVFEIVYCKNAESMLCKTKTASSTLVRV